MVHRADQQQTNKKKEENLYQCGYRNCTAVVTRMSQHLTRFHKLTDKEKIAEAKAKFTRIGKEKRKKQAHQSKNNAPTAKRSKLPPKESKNVVVKVPEHDSDSDVVIRKSAQLKRKRTQITSDHSSDETEESFQSGGSTTDEHEQIDHHQLDVDADIDDISSFAESDDDQYQLQPGEQQRWRDFHLAKDDKNVREHFLSTFHKYLLHVEGGAHSDQQSLLYVRQVHIILDVLDDKGKDLACLTKRGGLDIWDKFCLPQLRNKILIGNTLKVYLRSLEYFVKFIRKGLFYNKDLLSGHHKKIILSLRDRLPDYRATIHRRTAHENTTRKVDESFSRLTPADLRKVEASEIAMKAIKLIGNAAENKPLSTNEFVTVRNYLLVTTLYENGSRPGPLENAMITRFKQAQHTPSNRRWTILVDKHKTTRHHGPAELTVDERIYGYLEIYVKFIRPQFAVAGEDALFIKDDGRQFLPGTIGRRVTQFFTQAAIRTDVRVTATNIRKISDKAYELSPTKKRLINSHMKHRERTADSNYLLQVNTTHASKAHMLMSEIIREQPAKEASGKTPTKDQDDSDDSPNELDQSREETVPTAPYSPKPQDKDTDSEKDCAASLSSLGNDDKAVLLTVFNQEISTGSLLTMKEVRDKTRANL